MVQGTGIDRNPADEVEVKRPDNQRERYLSAEEIGNFKTAIDEKMYRKAGKGINETFFRLRLIVLVALTTGMRIAEIFGLNWGDVLHREGLVAVRAKLKGGKVRYVPMPPVFCLSWKWRERSAVKITERTHEKDEETLLSRREGSHSEATFAGPGADLEAVR